MTEPGSKISNTEVEELCDQLREQPESGTAVMRLVAAREYKAEVHVDADQPIQQRILWLVDARRCFQGLEATLEVM